MRASDLFLRFGIGTLAACLCATPAFAQETVTPSATTPDESADSNSNGDSYSLTGTVINDVTGEPVRRAAVQVSGHAGTMALTDAGGRFVLEGLAEGDVFLTAMKPGFYDDETSHTAPVRVGKDAPAVILKLTPSAVISGRVTTKDEQPLEGVHIRVLAQQNLEGRIVWADSQNLTVTDEEGEFRGAGLQAGTYSWRPTKVGRRRARRAS
jgi:protocatechuate 3,4-dioxygenase beta subunit